MSRAIFLLGPDHWDDGVAAVAPHWARETERSGPFRPFHIRKALGALISQESDGAVYGFVMDPSAQQTSEDDVALFERLEEQHHVDTYFFIVPCKATVLERALA